MKELKFTEQNTYDNLQHILNNSKNATFFGFEYNSNYNKELLFNEFPELQKLEENENINFENNLKQLVNIVIQLIENEDINIDLSDFQSQDKLFLLLVPFGYDNNDKNQIQYLMDFLHNLIYFDILILKKYSKDKLIVHDKLFKPEEVWLEDIKVNELFSIIVNSDIFFVIKQKHFISEWDIISTNVTDSDIVKQYFRNFNNEEELQNIIKLIINEIRKSLKTELLSLNLISNALIVEKKLDIPSQLFTSKFDIEFFTKLSYTRNCGSALFINNFIELKKYV